MNMIRKIHDRLTGVLGRDCNGKPLRQGDRVVPVIRVRPKFQCELIIVARSTREGRLALSNPEGDIKFGLTNHLRRIDENDDSASWDDVARLTGWTPAEIKQPETTGRTA